jgi:hypothetical protein
VNQRQTNIFMQKTIIGLFLFMSFATFSQNTDQVFLKNLLQQYPQYFDNILKNQDKYETQILYTQIDRDVRNKPSFKTFGYEVNRNRYFYPASTVKLPASLLALEKLNALKIKGLTRQTTMLTDATYDGHTPARTDSTAANGLPSIEHYIKKILMVSDNDAYNRLYEFLGQQYFNDALWQKGYNQRIIHRLQTGNTYEQNRRTNPIQFVDGSKVIYSQDMVVNDKDLRPTQKTTKGLGYYQKGKLVNEPFDFSEKNIFALEDQHKMLRAILFPETLPKKNRFNISPDDYRFVWKYMSQLPTESTYPAYDPAEFFPTFCKFVWAGSEKNATMPANMRIFNKVGDAYGFLLDNAYVVDFEKGVEFMLSVVIYVNEDQIFNDDKYEYDSVGFPFMKNLGQVLYDYECKRPRTHKPKLDKFKLVYDK